MKKHFAGKRILITGGTGSCGHQLIRRLLPFKPKEIRVYSRDEKKQYDMLKFEFSNEKKISYFLGDVRDKERTKEAMKDIDIVFHTAAMKHVWSCEANPFEAVKTNVLGAQNVVESSIATGVKKVLGFSTDKAVCPVNTMGITKAIQEKLFIEANLLPINKGTLFSCVRYGNVVNTRGTAVHLFRSQLSKGQKVTITDPDMTRFILSLNDAINLVFFAIANMKGTEIFVRKAPAANIVELAKLVAEEYPKTKFEYKVIGRIPGEKVHEILVSEEEMTRAENKGDYFIIRRREHKTDLLKPAHKDYSSKTAIAPASVIRKILRESIEEEEKFHRENIFTK